MAYLVSLLIDALTILIIVHVILSYVMSPYHPLREAIDRIVEPMLAPIRRVLPYMGGLDFSPVVLILIIQIIGSLLLRILF